MCLLIGQVYLHAPVCGRMIELVLPVDAEPSIHQEAVRLQLHESSIFTMEHVLCDMRGAWELSQDSTRPYPSRILRPPGPEHKGQTYASPRTGKREPMLAIKFPHVRQPWLTTGLTNYLARVGQYSNLRSGYSKKYRQG
jgi:hypothetical protein